MRTRRHQNPTPRHLLLVLALLAAPAASVSACALGELEGVPVVCGDGIVEGNEECDDGNRIDGDGCSAQCLRVGTGREGLCSNGLDDDRDGLFDCNDPDCADDTACTHAPSEICDNARDDDADSQVDCADPDCAADAACLSAGEVLCGNGRDDDGDGESDCADPDCDGRACDASGRRCVQGACSCPGGASETTCDDGLDDDCDGLVDCRDPDCAQAPACDMIEVDCSNGFDDNGDGLVDCADPHCAQQSCGPGGRLCQGEQCICPGGASESACQDGRDNDCDGLVDCADPDCAQAPACMSRETACADGLDNDSDGQADCADPDCDATACDASGRRCLDGACACPGGNSETSCTDGLDNDCDGLVDCADPDCAGQSCGAHGRTCAAEACSCPGGPTESRCQDGTDDDCDGLVDCADPDCSGAAGCAERLCDDGLDNDGDGTTDCLDADCDGLSCGPHGQRCAGFVCGCPGGATETSCTDGLDNDCDGLVDCADSQCAQHAACTAHCDVDSLLLCNFPVRHTTVGYGADVDAWGCGPTSATGPERIYRFLATTNSTVTFRLRNPTADLDLYLLQHATGQSTCAPASCLEASVATSGNDAITLQATAGQLYEVAVDGKNGAAGAYDLEFECVGGTSCAASAVVGCGFTEVWSTTGADATDNLNGYACNGWNESGPEYTYLFIPERSGLVTVSVDASVDPLGADLDVFVLAYNGGVCAASQCLAAGDTSASFTAVADTPYLVVVDGYQGDAGDFRITFGCPP